MKPIQIALFAAMLFAAPALWAAGFDCSKAASDVEKTICKDQSLSDLDGQLMGAYQKASAAVAPSNKDALVKEQRNWIKYVRNACGDAACLREVYTSRIALLDQGSKYIANRASCDIPDGSSCRSVVFYRDPSARIDSFNKSMALQKQGGKIVGCFKLIDLPTGTADGNHSFGGLCRLQNGAARSDVKICNDDMVGHFSMEPTDLGKESDKSLVDFVNAHCFGG